MLDQKGGWFKNIELFNIYLLMKWKWRILYERKEIWVGILNYMYRDLGISLLRNGDSKGRKGNFI